MGLVFLDFGGRQVQYSKNGYHLQLHSETYCFNSSNVQTNLNLLE